MFLRVTKHDSEYLHTLLMDSSVTVFVLCVVVLMSGACITRKHPFAEAGKFDPDHERKQLQFISTQLGACLYEHAYVSWGFVAAIQVQMLILLYTFLRLMYSQTQQDYFYGFRRDSVALMSGSLIVIFVYSMASVVEFRSDTPSRVEELYHYCSAVTAISVFFLVHALMSSCTHLSSTESMEYTVFKNYYLILTVAFFTLWINNAIFSTLVLFTRLTEWVILLMGVILHSFALFSMKHAYKSNQAKIKHQAATHHTHRKPGTQASSSVEETLTLQKTGGWVFTGLLTCVLFAVLSTRVFSPEDTKYLETGVEFWMIVLTTYLAVMCLLLFTRHGIGHNVY